MLFLIQITIFLVLEYNFIFYKLWSTPSFNNGGAFIYHFFAFIYNYNYVSNVHILGALLLYFALLGTITINHSIPMFEFDY